MVVGQTGLSGEPALSDAVVDPNSTVVLAPILLRLMVAHNAAGIGPSLESATITLAHVSTYNHVTQSTYKMTNRRISESKLGIYFPHALC